MAVAGLLIGFAVAILTLILWFLQPTRTKKLINKLPGPPTLPIIGNAHMFKPGGSEFYDQILDWTKLYDPERIFRVWIGYRPSVILFKADTAEVVLNTQKHMTKSADYDFLHPWLGTGLLTSTGDKWKGRRRLLTPTFHFRILNDFLQVFNEQSQVMVEKLSDKANGEVFDVFPLITHCALDTICETAMGKHVNAQSDSDSTYVKAVYKISELVHRRQKTPWLWPDVIYNNLTQGRQTQECLKVLHGFTQKVIQERSQELDEKLAGYSGDYNMEELGTGDESFGFGKKKRMAFLDMLLFAAKGESQLTFADIQEEVDTFMFEGHDTTAAAGNWAVYLIGAHPEVQRKVQEELDDIFGSSNREVTMEDKKEKSTDCDSA